MLLKLGHPDLFVLLNESEVVWVGHWQLRYITRTDLACIDTWHRFAQIAGLGWLGANACASPLVDSHVAAHIERSIFAHTHIARGDGFL